MGRRKHSPKHGSMSYSPRKRARSVNGRVTYWPSVRDGPRLLGFAGYKAGMLHVFFVEDRDRAPDFGKEISSSVTILDTPPMLVGGLRIYRESPDGLKAVTEVWMKDLPADIGRAMKSPPSGIESGEAQERMSALADSIKEIRAVMWTQPRQAGFSRKKPDTMEIKIGGGSAKEQLDYAMSLLGKQVRISEVFKVGEYTDLIGVGKGKGFQGPVKRWGIKIRPRKTRKHRRQVASLGPWHPARVRPQVPRAGQMGFHQRTEYNKMILQIGDNGKEITPSGGFNRFGEVKGDFLMIRGSVIGPQKRLIRLRKPVRKPGVVEAARSMTYVYTRLQGGSTNA